MACLPPCSLTSSLVLLHLINDRLHQRNMKNSDWAFNLRATANLEDSSDSDSDDCAALLKNNPISPEAQLLKDLDLSSRHETVEYKPNPWNIAKMNAVSRTTRPPPDHGTTINSVRAKKPPRGRIVDLFKTQSEKPHRTGGIKLDDPVHRTPSEKPVVVCRDRLPINAIRKDAPQVVDGVPGNILAQENIQKYARISQGYQSIVNPQPRPRPAKPISISTSFSSPLPDHNRRVRQRTTWNSHSAFHSSPIKLTHNASRFVDNTSGMAEGGEGVGELDLDSRFRASRRSQKMGASSSLFIHVANLFFQKTPIFILILTSNHEHPTHTHPSLLSLNVSDPHFFRAITNNRHICIQVPFEKGLYHTLITDL